MGVKDLMPKIKGGIKTTELKKLVDDIEGEAWIGVDMSILLIQSVKSSPTLIEHLFTIPFRPVNDLNEKVCEKLKPLFECGAFVVCVFDGLPGQLKKDYAHKVRYGQTTEWKEQLQELYNENPNSPEEEDMLFEKVKDLRKKLASVNRPDLLYSLEQTMEKRFGKQHFVCIGSAFEADHQLASLSRQKIIDYVWTNDSDLSCLGCDVILNLKYNGQKKKYECLLVKHQYLLTHQFPKEFEKKKWKEDIRHSWNIDLLHHVACFLGNDFIERNPGNSISKVEKFIDNITEEDRTMKSDEAIYSYIKNSALIPKGSKEKEANEWKEKWTDGKKIQHTKLWKHAKGMFSDGPAFSISVEDSSVSIREQFRTGRYKVHLGSYRNGSSNWKIHNNEGEVDDLLVGFDPEIDLKKALSVREEFVDGDSDSERYLNIDEDTYQFLIKKVFNFKIWSKDGKDIVGLPVLEDERGRALYPGSMLDFNVAPIWSYSKQTLDLWLSCRQINSDNARTLQHTRNLVKIIQEKLGDTLKPIFIELMRGSAGYVSPELLKARDGDERNVQKLAGDQALEVVRKSFPNLSEDEFTRLFGKRNGTRKRIMMHLTGGSFDIQKLRVTQDLMSTAEPEKKIIVFTMGCAPSQKLKDGGKEKYYDLVIAIEVDEDGTFLEFLKHPIARCGCPNGCILCAHLGAFILLLLALKNYDCITANVDGGFVINDANEAIEREYTSFDHIRSKLPAPVNSLLVRPMICKYAIPKNDSEQKKASNNYLRETQDESEAFANINARTQSNVESDLQRDARDRGYDLPQENEDLIEYALEDASIIDATDTETQKVVKEANKWLFHLRNGRDPNGKELKTMDEIDKALEDEANYRKSDEYRAVEITRHEKMIELCEEFMPRFYVNKADETNVGSDNMILQPKPTCYDVLIKTSRNREREKQKLIRKGIDMESVKLNVLARDQKNLWKGDDN
ncbi:hypothetical protein CTEN210_11573 [Chaetoceros tenuissimus]|uniref:XPG-I domain-containing protein n=1 Tax=Chaetoceros tenuissimus TaxID=426638 RepID=A0AAD3H912_9STRA|nr:hypothetical protein CTEN210_11573 [Chaetoceros tenuissimus]